MTEFDLDDQFDSDIDLTPLIDVIFLLIIFFVLATTFSKPVLDVVLPSSQAASKIKSDKKDLIIEINEAGEIYCENRKYDKDEINELIDYKTDLRMNLHIDKTAPFDSFISIIDSAKLAKRKDIVITTKK